ncbi:hypothetical protein NKG99_06980 [Mesorhizobium sp. M1409]|uniref:hypothetical protein n=1 Tax=unclassified Mesorhizobium TaxID=325217 RepID=UPI003335AFAE
MYEWDTDEYRVDQRRQYEAIATVFPGLATKRFECNAGWFSIIREFFLVVRQVIPVGREDAFDLRQVKEKFGNLCIYYRTADDLPDAVKIELSKAYRAAEASAVRTCEVCGAPGVLRVRGGWYATRCDDHADGGVPVPPLSKEKTR